jgi:hypothetical protein
MGEITQKYVSQFAKNKSGKVIQNAPLSSRLRCDQGAQRGPSCGFYALGFVMQYWSLQQERDTQGTDYGPPLKTIPVRTHMNVEDKSSKTEVQRHAERIARLDTILEGEQYASLRQYGKIMDTVYGGMFNAESLVGVARGLCSQWEGMYDGRVVHVSWVEGVDGLLRKAKTLLDADYPVIIPYDTEQGQRKDGEPTNAKGDKAHWATLVGYYPHTKIDNLIYYTWGDYYYCEAQKMAESCLQLTSNVISEVMKYEIRKGGTLIDRDFLTDAEVQRRKREGCDVQPIGNVRKCYDFCDPQSLKHLESCLKKVEFAALSKELISRRQGFDPGKLANAGLKGNLVVVYPAALKTKVDSLLSKS